MLVTLHEVIYNLSSFLTRICGQVGSSVFSLIGEIAFEPGGPLLRSVRQFWPPRKLRQHWNLCLSPSLTLYLLCEFSFFLACLLVNDNREEEVKSHERFSLFKICFLSYCTFSFKSHSITFFNTNKCIFLHEFLGILLFQQNCRLCHLFISQNCFFDLSDWCSLCIYFVRLK